MINIVFFLVAILPVVLLVWRLVPSYNIYHIPTVPILPFIISFIKREPNDERVERLVLPLLLKHGVVKLWLSKWIVYVYDVEKAKEIFTKTDIFPKMSLISTNPHSLANKFLGTNVVFISGEEWKRHRKAINPAFHRSWSTQLIGSCCDALLNKMESADGPLEVLSLFKGMTLDALGKVVFDFDFEAIKNPEGKHVSLYSDIMKEFQKPLFFFFPFLEHPIFNIRKSSLQKVKEFRELISNVLDEKRKALNENPSLGDEGTDLLTLMVKATQEPDEDGNPLLSTEELIDNTIIFFLAGHDTTANTLSYTMYYLSKHPEIQRKARQEVFDIMGKEKRIPTLEEAKKMTYLTAIIHESMRINPTVGQLSRTLSEDYEVAPGVVLKEGQMVGIQLYAMLHNPKYWPKPYEFNPDRFLTYSLDEDSKPKMEFNKQATKAWYPFGGGPRSCIGMSFSILEQRVMMSMLLSRFEIQLPENSPHLNRVISSAGGLAHPQDLELNFITI